MTKWFRRLPSSAGFFYALRAWAPALRRPLRLRRFQMRLFFSTGDAAETAMLHGWLHGLFSSLRPLLARGTPRIALRPSFSVRRELSLNCNIFLDIPAVLFLFHVFRVLHTNKRSAHV
jgi:hypothetical protein